MADSPAGGIRDYEEWARSIRNFANWVGDAVPGGSDLDFICERKGQFLVVEGKHYHQGMMIPYGQWLMLKQLAKLPQFTVLLVGEGDDDQLFITDLDNPDLDCTFSRGRGMCVGPRSFVTSNVEGLQETLREWWEWATAGDP